MKPDDPQTPEQLFLSFLWRTLVGMVVVVVTVRFGFNAGLAAAIVAGVITM